MKNSYTLACFRSPKTQFILEILAIIQWLHSFLGVCDSLGRSILVVEASPKRLFSKETRNCGADCITELLVENAVDEKIRATVDLYIVI